MFAFFKEKKDKDNSIKPNVKPKKKHPQGTSRYTLRKSLKEGFLKGTLVRDSVKCPPGEVENDWIAIHTIEIYNTMNHCYAFVQDYCTEEGCPKMNGNKATYLWSDGTSKPQELPARKYIDNLSNWIGDQIDNPEIFPLEDNYTKAFRPAVKKILSRILRVYSHIYYQHWANIKTLECDKHINTSLKVCLNNYYNSVDHYI
ncbi:Mob1-like protein [Heterostelium album PN500]|uniref:Mob1-like protein n=1 Tax=Heterostelium pallidum (strain ATCC 26659 / Pp 5 / PN500) TaxID=670386 RepID=D3BMV6_HETP5|nr:Mob1-like protein [Heterostelium album PN500]EFA77318.1 Mob1-like protein [Heterostelium album PN500]|eukprot:XP_020429447.1 Mob1-like protein [Heterostelium album PN500]